MAKLSRDEKRHRAQQRNRAKNFARHSRWTLDETQGRKLRHAVRSESCVLFVMRSERLLRMAVAFPAYAGGNAVVLGCLDYPTGIDDVKRAAQEVDVKETIRALARMRL